MKLIKAPSTVIVISACFLFGALPIHAAMITCSATANGLTANLCIEANKINPSKSNQTSYVNDNFQDSGDPFSFVGKFEGNGVESNVLKVDTLSSGQYQFDYELVVPSEWQGKVVDWTLLIKQANSTIAYLFSGIELDSVITGSFNNFWTNPNGKSVNNYSHVSGFMRETQKTEAFDILGFPESDEVVVNNLSPLSLPELDVYWLLSIGLIVFGWSRRKRLRAVQFI